MVLVGFLQSHFSLSNSISKELLCYHCSVYNHSKSKVKEEKKEGRKEGEKEQGRKGKERRKKGKKTRTQQLQSQWVNCFSAMILLKTGIFDYSKMPAKSQLFVFGSQM